MPQTSKHRRWLCEDFARGTSALRVDREAGVIYRVKVLGTESVNGMDGMARVKRRIYSRQAMANSLGLYEGCHVNIDHPAKPGEQRSTYDRFGVLEHVELLEDGIYANLRYLKSHTMAERVCEAAERMPDAFGLSHSAEALGDVEGDAYVVTEIVSVNSVDLVADPATNKGLFEAKMAKQVAEEMGCPTKATEGDEEGGWKHHLGEMIKSMVADGEMDHDEMSAKVMHALKTMKKGQTEPEEEGEDLQANAANADGAEQGPPSGKKPKNDTTEAVQALRSHADPAVKLLLETVDRLETKARLQDKLAEAHTLIEAAGLPKEAVSEVFLDSLVAAPGKKAMQQLVEDRRSLVHSKRPRSFGGGSAGKEMDAKAFAKALRNGN